MAISVTGKIKFDLSGIPNNIKKEALEDVADALELEILSTIGDGESPIEGEQWKKELDPKYKKIKGEISSSNFANMELTGEMIDDFKVKTDGNTIKFGFFKDEANELSLLKAENHNKWTSKAKKTAVPQRRFIPKPGQTLKKEIMNRLNSILDDYRGDE